MELPTLDKINGEFEKFFAASPFSGMGERYKIAMQGAYLAGWISLAEEFKKFADAPKSS